MASAIEWRRDAAANFDRLRACIWQKFTSHYLPSTNSSGKKEAFGIVELMNVKSVVELQAGHGPAMTKPKPFHDRRWMSSQRLLLQVNPGDRLRPRPLRPERSTRPQQTTPGSRSAFQGKLSLAGWVWCGAVELGSG